ncbi:MAG: hypothetical protein K0Q76_4301 [Panacagrimonas sp.]|nr:hypothetical protein [Panacagrimonas sp.]
MARWHTAPASRLLLHDASTALPPLQVHRRLAAFNRKRLLPTFEEPCWPEALNEEIELRSLEARFVHAERTAIAPRLSDLPTDAPGFMDWFHALKDNGPGQGDALFAWLATDATIDQMRWFLRQEAAGEAGFDDLVALTQVRFPSRPKLEMANNYWDEMGRGRESGMHGPMLERTTQALDLRPSVETTAWESLALANLMVALAANRHLAYQSVGALGAIEMTAPGRVSKVNEGMRRLGLPAEVRRYFQLHAGLDVRHSLAWNREVIEPLVAADPNAARPIAEGALLRLAAGARCFERYRRDLKLTTSTATAVPHDEMDCDTRRVAA